MHFTWGFGPKQTPETDPEVLRRLERIDRRLDGIYIALERARERSMATTEAVQRLVTEVEETKGKIASVLAFVAGVPALIRVAVEEARAANPGLTAEDLAAISAAADDLDAAQGEIAAALDANPEEPAALQETLAPEGAEQAPAAPEPEWDRDGEGGGDG